MGCCQSDLKGDQQADVNNDSPNIKKVQTNFSTIDYDASASGRRDTIYAPHEAERQKSDAGRSDLISPGTEKKSNPILQELPETTAAASASTQPQAATDPPKFENKIPDQPGQEPTTLKTKHEDDEHKPPYEDVTASPTSPTTPGTIDEKITRTPAPTPAVEQPPK